MSYHPHRELADIAHTLEEGFECSEYDAHQAAQAVQEVVDRHRGGGDPLIRLQALQDRYDTLYAAVLKWSEASRANWSRADMELDEAAGISFPLTPLDDDA